MGVFDIMPPMPTDHAAMMKFINNIIEEFGDSISLSYLGATVCGRAIPILTLGEGDDAVIYVGAHHGMEWITSALLLKFAAESAAERYDFGAEVAVIPMLNCDGVDLQINGADKNSPLYSRQIAMNKGEDFSHWQANARGVDLNHNYDAGFRKYKEIEDKEGIPCGAPTKYAGLYPESEPEVGALCNYMRFNRRIKAALTFHTQGEVIYRGSAGASLSESQRIAKEIEKIVPYRFCEPEGEGASLCGMSDWVTSVLEIPSFTVECGSGVNPLPQTDFDGIYETIKPLLFRFPKFAANRGAV